MCKKTSLLIVLEFINNCVQNSSAFFFSKSFNNFANPACLLFVCISVANIYGTRWLTINN